MANECFHSFGINTILLQSHLQQVECQRFVISLFAHAEGSSRCVVRHSRIWKAHDVPADYRFIQEKPLALPHTKQVQGEISFIQSRVSASQRAEAEAEDTSSSYLQYSRHLQQTQKMIVQTQLTQDVRVKLDNALSVGDRCTYSQR